jgi:hypothetical protein
VPRLTPTPGDAPYGGRVDPTEDVGAQDVDRGLTFGRYRIDVAAWVYATVTVMSVLAVYDGWEDRKRYVGVVIVVIAPTLALAMAHLFADVLDFHVRRHRPPTRHEWWVMTEHATQYLLVAVPMLLILVVTGFIPSVDLRGSITCMLAFAILSLGWWGWIAGRHAGLRGARLLAASCAGLLIGVIVIGMQILLKPH